jgi:uracil-DNA glycosylase family 4
MGYEAIAPPEEVKGKRGRGRPKTELASPVYLYNFPGRTKEEKLVQLYAGPLKDEKGWFDCQRCFLGEYRCQMSKGKDQDTVFFHGNPEAHVLIVGEAPGEKEAEEKIPFIGSAGQILNLLLSSTSDDPEIQELCAQYAGMKHTPELQNEFHAKIFDWRHSEFAITNVVSCRPPDNRAPTLVEMKACWERLHNIIYIVDPLLIIACGNTAIAMVTRKLSAQVTKVRGQIFDVEYQGKVTTYKKPVMPILHPSYLARMADWNVKGGTFDKTRQDILSAMRMVDFLRNQYWGTPIPRRLP